MAAAAGGIAEAAAGETPGRPFMDLVASLTTTIYTLYGVADMHLSYVVFRFPFEGGEFPHYVAEAVVALGPLALLPISTPPSRACRSHLCVYF